MKILLLDDDPVRHDVFGDRWADDDLTHASTYAAAIAALQLERFDRVALDHEQPFKP